MKIELDGLIVHEQAAIRRNYFKQKKPIKGNYSKINDDYVARLFRGEVSQSDTGLGRLTNQLHSSMKPVSIKRDSSSYRLPEKPTPSYSARQDTFYSPKLSSPYSFEKKTNYSQEQDY